ncbi:hypothetical protein [Pseudoalteromonas sp. H105]|uniref:hypothetical protein n=1 Tax=Pseudoalteromonas sp. H105 TaxID=1348393 RepID=UPI00128EF33D|nr:hypothetical protein [Pseudoalteromonas sp. H105]
MFIGILGKTLLNAKFNYGVLMYFWKIESLKSDLREGNLTQSNDLKYLAGTLVLFVLASFPSDTVNLFDYFNILLGVLSVICGTALCFFANGGNQGSDFLRRYLSISWVVGIRLLVTTVPIFILIYVVVELAGYGFSEETNSLDLALQTVFSVFYYWRVIHYIKQISE